MRTQTNSDKLHHQVYQRNYPARSVTPPRQEDYLPADISFLLKEGMDLKTLFAAVESAKQLGISPSEYLIGEGEITESGYFKSLASHFGLRFDDIDILRCEVLGELGNRQNLIAGAKLVLARNGGPFPTIYIAPTGHAVKKLSEFLQRYPSIKCRIIVTTGSAIRQLFIARRKVSLTHIAVSSLARKLPAFSASTVITAGQWFVFAAWLTIATTWLIIAGNLTIWLLHIFASTFYLLCVGVRTAAALARTDKPLESTSFKPVGNTMQTPVYSVLVALYHEQSQVKDLIANLSKIQWPQNRLEIKLICEEDDQETIDAVLKHIPGPPFELVIVPPSLPRTKPKALNFALNICRGDLIVLYDAEDRPHPRQVIEAYTRFCRQDGNLACLQAPLVIHNHYQGWLPSMFAIEYSALFSGLLPILARWKTPVPLGGTSNHFRRSALEIVGAWDPYNVTEDADLGIRLARMGYKTGVLHLPTYEEAPVQLDPWIKQRTRWFKGWLQTWLVHMRDPVRLHKELGLFNTFMFHTLITGMIVSALMHPFFIVSLLYALYHLSVLEAPAGFYRILASIDIANIALGYISFGFLAWKALPISKLGGLRRQLIGIPLYWLLISYASWRAVWHLCTRPFEWEKTPHVMTCDKG